MRVQRHNSRYCPLRQLECFIASLQLTVSARHLTITKTAFETVDVSIVIDGDEEECCMAQLQRFQNEYAVTNAPRHHTRVANALFLGAENELWTRFLEPMPKEERERNVQDVLKRCTDRQEEWEARVSRTIDEIRKVLDPAEAEAALRPYMEQLMKTREKLARDREEAESKSVTKLKKAFIAHDYYIKAGPLVRAVRDDAKQLRPQNENVSFITRRVYPVDALIEAGFMRRKANTEPASVFITADQSGRSVAAARPPAKWKWLAPWTWPSTIRQWRRDNVSNLATVEFEPLVKGFMTTERKKLHQTLDKGLWDLDRHCIEAAMEANRELPALTGGEPRYLTQYKVAQQKVIGYMMDQEDMQRPLGAEDLQEVTLDDKYKDPSERKDEGANSDQY